MALEGVGSMIRVAVLNAKGGVGKTTIATALAARAARDFRMVGLVDLDPQQGAARWHGHRRVGDDESPQLFRGTDSAADAAEALELAGYEVAIFDGAPGSLSQTEDAIQAATLVLIPLRAGDQDLASTEYVVSACRDFGVPYLLVLNEAASVRDKRALEVLEGFKSIGEPICDTLICRRVHYVDGINMGRSAAELRGGEKAAQEIDGLWADVMRRLKIAQQRSTRRAG
jgi:chromosome partitioning protein